ncbi:MAG: MlaD family protein [Halofilum sp. (in: g-proteobacteria)]
METRAHHVLIGLFTVLGVSAALLFALWLARPGGDHTEVYDVVFREPVTGLAVGSAVRYSGIQVGRVDQLRLDPEDPRQVRARIEVNPQTPIKTDTRAQLRLAGLTGGAEIHLSGGSLGSQPLTHPGDQVPRIVADPSALAQITGGGEQLFERVLRLVDRADQVLSDENIRNLSATLEHLNQTSRVIADHRDELGHTLRNLNEGSADARRVAAETARLVDRANVMLAERGEPLLESSTRTIASLERTSSRLERLLSENETALEAGMQGLGDVGPLMQELRATVAALSEITRQLEEDPAAYLFGRDEIREFEP